MIEVGLIGGGFQHAYSSTLWKIPTYFTWSKNQIKDITFFVDEDIVKNINSTYNTKKIAWIVESSAIIPEVIKKIKEQSKEISNAYEFLITHDKSISCLADNFYYLPPSGYWIENPECYPKTRLCSMITSNKTQCEGHLYRLHWADKLKDKVDLFGRGIREFNKKEDALADYMFSVTMENASYDGYWSEKILDCFACGTIPIYHGDPNIGDYFNIDGIIKLDDSFDPNLLTPELYLSKEEAIIDNFNRTLKYNIIEDILWERYIKKMMVKK
jgi:hypothetical protein